MQGIIRLLGGFEMPYSFMPVPITLCHNRVFESCFCLTFRNPFLHSCFEYRYNVRICFGEVVVFVGILNEIVQFDRRF